MKPRVCVVCPGMYYASIDGWLFVVCLCRCTKGGCSPSTEKHQPWAFLKNFGQYCHMELLEGETGLLQAAIPSEVSGVTAQLCAVARDLAHHLSMSESMRLLKLQLGRLFSFSCRGEQRCRILLRNCNDISKRYFLSLGHLLRHIVMLICIQIDCKGYM